MAHNVSISFYFLVFSAAEQPTQTAIRLKRVTPISLVSVDSLSTATAETAAATGADGATASTNHANSITLSTYIFVLLTVLSCMVGSVFSFICCKLVNNDRKI